MIQRTLWTSSPSRLTEIGTELANGFEQGMTIRDADPQDATLTERRWMSWMRRDWKVRVETTLDLTLMKTDFVLKAEVIAHEDGQVAFRKAWNHMIPRLLV